MKINVNPALLVQTSALLNTIFEVFFGTSVAFYTLFTTTSIILISVCFIVYKHPIMPFSCKRFSCLMLAHPTF